MTQNALGDDFQSFCWDNFFFRPSKPKIVLKNAVKWPFLTPKKNPRKFFIFFLLGENDVKFLGPISKIRQKTRIYGKNNRFYGIFAVFTGSNLPLRTFFSEIFHKYVEGTYTLQKNLFLAQMDHYSPRKPQKTPFFGFFSTPKKNMNTWVRS